MSTGNVPSVPSQYTGQGPIYLPRVANPYLGVWWNTQTVSGIPENTMGWLVAQGFEVTGISQDHSTSPPTNYFALTREGMKPQEVLLSLCNAYTISANEARTANEIRYNDIVTNWNATVASSQAQFDAQVDLQNAQAGVYMADLDRYMDEVDVLIQENRNQLVVDAQTAQNALGELNSRLEEAESNAGATATIIIDLLNDQQSFLGTFLSNFSSKLSQLDQDFNAHLTAVLLNISNLETVTDDHITAYESKFTDLAKNYADHAILINQLLATALINVNDFKTAVELLLNNLFPDYTAVQIGLNGLLDDATTLAENHGIDYNGVLNLLLSDYNDHVPIATGFLTNLGTTELARINEQFDATLADQTQDLISRGLYSSIVALDIRERNHRDRDEQIQALNDRLNREKWENQHRLYEQQVAMRARTLDGKDRIHTVRQEILRYHATQISLVYNLLQDVRNRELQGRQSILAAQEGNTRLNIDVQTGLYSNLQEIVSRTIEASVRIFSLRDAFVKWKNGESIQLFEQLQRIQTQHLTGIERQHSLSQEVSRIAMTQRDSLLQQLQTALQGWIGGKERYSSLVMQQSSQLADHKHRAIVESMNTAVQRLQGWAMTQDQNRSLMAYQLDERNKLLIGLYTFVKERDDIGPEWESMAKIVSSLGDAGGGWVTP